MVPTGELSKYPWLAKNKTQLKFIENALCVAKKCIMVSWKFYSPLRNDRWLFEMNSCIALDKNHILSQKTVRHLFENMAAICRPYLLVSCGQKQNSEC